MAHKIDEAYEKAVSSGLLPGVCVIAGDKNGEIQSPLALLANPGDDWSKS